MSFAYLDIPFFKWKNGASLLFLYILWCIPSFPKSTHPFLFVNNIGIYDREANPATTNIHMQQM